MLLVVHKCSDFNIFHFFTFGLNTGFLKSIY
nr:MAG TPA: hypothetical protein [Caudoviricetes sp.]